MKNNYLLIGGVALLLAAGTLYGVGPRQAYGEHTVTTLRGRTIVVRAEGRVFIANAPDGNYKLTNGGAIRVRGGKVVWDAFGAVNRLKTGRWRGGSTDPTG